MPFKDIWLEDRQRARTDLLWLCNDVLDYKDVSERVHGRILAALQSFKGGTDKLYGYKEQGIQFAYSRIEYTPICSMWDLTGPRKNLIMFPRGCLKTTIDMAHVIQWIVNYPEIRILISSAIGEQVEKFVFEIKNHFTQNAKFRYLFPDFCPQGKKIAEWGTIRSFRTRASSKKEPTVSTVTIGQVVAGGHFDVIKHDDLVDKENIKTKGAVQTTIDHFGSMGPLLEPSHTNPFEEGWVDILGTPYHFSDLYATLQKGEAAAEKKVWNMIVISAAPNYPAGPYLWPERLGYEKLKAIENDPTRGLAHLSSQYLMKPIGDGQGLIEDEKEIIFKPRRVMGELLARLRLSCTIDLAGMDTNAKGKDNDYTVLNVSGWDSDGRLYCIQLDHGRFPPEEVIDRMYAIYEKYPRIMRFKVPKDQSARVLMPFLKRERSKRGWLPIEEYDIDNKMAKTHKIMGLRPWLKAGLISFSDDIPAKLHIIWEIMQFPKYSHDDILDTICDHIFNPDGSVSPDVIPAEKAGAEKSGITVREDGSRVHAPAIGGPLEEIIWGLEDQMVPAGLDPITGW